MSDHATVSCSATGSFLQPAGTSWLLRV